MRLGARPVRRMLVGLAAALLLLACAAVPAPPTPSAPPQAAPLPTSPALAAPPGLAARIAAEGFAPKEVGLLLLDADTGDELQALNADAPFIPASTAKLVTALVAPAVLGSGYRFRTELLATDEVVGGALGGDLVLRGGGDPVLDVADLLALALELKEARVALVTGRFLVDDASLPRFALIAADQPATAAYNAGVGALSLAFNRVRLLRDDGLFTVPPLAEARLVPAAPGTLPADGVVVEPGPDGTQLWRLPERADAGGPGELPVKDPGLHTARVFRGLADGLGITLPEPVRGAAPPGARVVASHASPPLGALVHDLLLYSNNQMAELIGLGASARLGPPPRTLAQSAMRLAGTLGPRAPDVDWRGLVLVNHSGLGSGARMTPRQLAALLRLGLAEQGLPALLPASGWSGTLARRLGERATALRVWAKTGTIAYASALAGYLLPKSGRPLVAVVLVSDFTARAAYDALDPPDQAAETEAARWLARARSLQDALILDWLGFRAIAPAT